MFAERLIEALDNGGYFDRWRGRRGVMSYLIRKWDVRQIRKYVATLKTIKGDLWV